MPQVNNINNVINQIDLGPSASLQLQFAKLQLALSEMSKNSALDYIDQIQKSQDEQKKVSQLLQQARQAQADAGDKKGKTEMSPELKAYMDANGLTYNKGNIDKITKEIASNEKLLDDCTKRVETLEKRIAANPVTSASDQLELAVCKAHVKDYTAKIEKLKAELATPPSFTKDEWETTITSLKAHLDQLGTDTQQKMVFVQDFMGQYNSYLQGANSAIQQSNQTLSELARVR